MPTLWPFFITTWRYRWLLVGLSALGGGLGYLWATEQAQIATARGTYFLNPQAVQTTVWRDLNQRPNADLLTRLAQQPRVVRTVLQQQGLLAPGAPAAAAPEAVPLAAKQLLVTTRPGQVVELWVHHADAPTAVGLVGHWAQVLNEEIRQQELSRGFNPPQLVLTAIETPALVPSTRHSTGVGSGLLFGGLAAVWLIALAELGRRHRANPGLIEQKLGQRVLGYLPPLGRLQAHQGRLRP